MERAKAQPNLLEILIRNSQATQTTESQAPVQSNTIQAKSDTTGDRPDLSKEQRPNETGMPDALKAGVESLSGYSLDDVRVHYNSPKPAQLQALAYTQGTEIHVASGQEKHLPHEAWHVVQQKQGRVQPTLQMKRGVNINDNDGLEKEADVMGNMAWEKYSHTDSIDSVQLKKPIMNSSFSIVQRQWKPKEMKKLAAMSEKERTKYLITTKYGEVDDVVSYYLEHLDQAVSELALVLTCYYEVDEKERMEILEKFQIKVNKNTQIDEVVENSIAKANNAIKSKDDEGKAISSIKGGALTSIRDDFGDLSPSLSSEGRKDKLNLASSFGDFLGVQPLPQEFQNTPMITLFRRVKSSNLKSLAPGNEIDEIVPFSTSWEEGFVRKWSPTEGVIFEFEIPVTYPALFQSRRPGAQVKPEAPEGMNEKQAEVTLIQSRFKVLSPGENRNGEIFVKVSIEPLSLDIARNQHEAMNKMTDNERRMVAQQQGEDAVTEPTDMQIQIKDQLAQKESEIAKVIELAKKASQQQIRHVKKRIEEIDEKHQQNLPSILGVGYSVIKGFDTLNDSSPELLATLIRRLFSPEYLVDSKLPAKHTVGFLFIILNEFQKVFKN
ncbi:DUF4157 domain-containing protein [Pseudanabaena sp. BC1403]|uniref:eCIS core domain-containing protein n=1 Tax=Pseudanabaena sp. BC1403 TaxID=2043171 RepID=UPI00215651DA|nr:DUF4157 domain-containing protein [Pseudanabaena sp. BC1403]